MPKGGRGKKRKNDEQNVQESTGTAKRQNANGSEAGKATAARSTRSTTKPASTQQGRRTPKTGGKAENQQLPDPRSILLGKSTNNNAKLIQEVSKTNKSDPPSVVLGTGEESTSKQAGAASGGQTIAEKSPVLAITTQEKGKSDPKSTGVGLGIEEDPGTELDYEDNLDLDVAVTGAVAEEKSGSDDEETTIMNMMRDNPKLKQLFRQIVLHLRRSKTRRPD